MRDLNLVEEDKKKLIEFLNMVALKAQFNLNTNEIIQYFNLLSFMQKTLLPKVEANILEVKRVIEAQQEAPKGE